LTTTNQLVAGIDIGGTNILFGLVDSEGTIRIKRSIPTGNLSPEALVNHVSTEIRKEVNSLNGSYELAGIGIGAPNGNFYTGTIEFAANLKWEGAIPLARLFQDELGVDAILTNDAKAATLGEMIFGGARGMKNFLFITLGTGLGSGIVINGELVHGHDGFAGEIGHMIVAPDGRPCACGRRGCLETYCSATGIMRTYADMRIGKHKKTEVSAKINDARYIYDKAMNGDSSAVEAFNYTGELLGMALANCVACFSPESIFLFGGLAQAKNLIFKPTIKSFEKNLLRVYKNSNIQILPSQLKESDAAILGAASLIWKRILETEEVNWIKAKTG
jgi:glucokinase